ncbi:MAG: hypothetical protein AAB225_12190 [Acidobacteriota bacterium]
MMLLAWAAVLSLLVVAVVVARRATVAVRRAQAVPIPWSRVTPQQYRPMERFFPAADYEFLAVQPGFRPEIAEGVLAERRRQMRPYFRSLGRDFENLRAVGKLLLRSRSGGRHGPVFALWKQRLRFWYILAAADGGLLSETSGLRAEDVRRLAEPVETIMGQLGSLGAASRTAKKA